MNFCSINDRTVKTVEKRRKSQCLSQINVHYFFTQLKIITFQILQSLDFVNTACSQEEKKRIVAILYQLNLFSKQQTINCKCGITECTNWKSLPLQHRHHKVCFPKAAYFSSSCSEKEKKKEWLVFGMHSVLYVPFAVSFLCKKPDWLSMPFLQQQNWHHKSFGSKCLVAYQFQTEQQSNVSCLRVHSGLLKDRNIVNYWTKEL